MSEQWLDAFLNLKSGKCLHHIDDEKDVTYAYEDAINMSDRVLCICCSTSDKPVVVRSTLCRIFCEPYWAPTCPSCGDSSGTLIPFHLIPKEVQQRGLSYIVASAQSFI